MNLTSECLTYKELRNDAKSVSLSSPSVIDLMLTTVKEFEVNKDQRTMFL